MHKSQDLLLLNRLQFSNPIVYLQLYFEEIDLKYIPMTLNLLLYFEETGLKYNQMTLDLLMSIEAKLGKG